jgi:hypothetical protein
VRDLLRTHDVQIYSEASITGHTTETIVRFGWFIAGGEQPEYSTLSFAIVPAANADSVFASIAELSRREQSDHPIRAFLVPVERMV